MADRNVEYEIRLRDRISSNLNRIERQTDRTTRAFKGLNAIISAISVGAVVSLGREALATAAKYEALNKAISFSSGNSLQASINLRFLREQSEGLGLSYEAMAEGFKTFSGAMRGSIFTQAQQRDMFLKVSKAAKVMQLDGESTKGTFLALGQIMSKGKVQAEELRGQIGERIPGAFQIAAKAMGMTTAELDKMMSDGKLLATDFLPKFADQLEKEFAGGVEAATNSIQTQLNNLSNSWDQTLTNMGKSIAKSGIVDGMSAILKETNKFYSDIEKFENYVLNIWGGDKKSIGGMLFNPFGENATDAKLFYDAYKTITPAAEHTIGIINKKYQELGETQRQAYQLKQTGIWDKNLERLQFQYEMLRKVGDLETKEMQTIREKIEFYKKLKMSAMDIFALENTGEAQDLASEAAAKTKKTVGVTLRASSPKTININIDKQVGIEQVSTTTINESYPQVADAVERAMLQGLAQAEQVAQ